MKPFDTCCKKCAQSEGGGEHDLNCGGAKTAEVRRRTEMPPRSPKAILDELVSTVGSKTGPFRTTVTNIFKQVAGDSDVISQPQVKAAVKMLLEPLAASIPVRDTTVAELVTRFDRTKSGGLNEADFRALCVFLVTDRQEVWFPEKLPARTTWFVRKNPMQVKKVYEFFSLLGTGSYGKVYDVVHKVSGEKRVCKQISKVKGLMETSEILREIENMALLDHPNVIKVFEYFEDAENFSQILEPCRGGELQDKIDDRFKKGISTYDEVFMCDVVKQTLRALAFLHANRFIHKDLKPQNIMLVDRNRAWIKLIDFGLTELFKPDQKFSSVFGGTLLYMAPEHFAQRLTPKIDVWACGVVIYNLVTGDYPFLAQWPPPPPKGEDWWQQEVKRIILHDTMKPHRGFVDGRVSPTVRDLVERMFCKDPNSRPDASMCLDHTWFGQFATEAPTLSVGVTQCLDAYAKQPAFKKVVFLLIAHHCNPPAIEELRAIFTHFDHSNRGSLDTNTFTEVLSWSGMSPLQAERAIHALDLDNSGSVEWTEFLSAALCISVCQNQLLVESAFNSFDTDSDGRVSVRDIESLLARGSTASVWKRKLPAECTVISGGSSPTFTIDQFKEYVGQQMSVVGGDALNAV